MNTRNYERNPVARRRAGKRQTYRQLVIQRALLEDRLKTVNRSLDNYEKSLPRSHVTPDRKPHDSNNLAEISSITELSNKLDELIRIAENYLGVNPGEPSIAMSQELFGFGKKKASSVNNLTVSNPNLQLQEEARELDPFLATNYEYMNMLK